MKLKLAASVLLTAILSVVQLDAQEVTLTVTADPPQCGTITGAGTYAKGANIPMDISAIDGWYIKSIQNSEGDGYAPDGSVLEFTKTVSALKLKIYSDPYNGDKHILNSWLTAITNTSESFVLNSDATMAVTFAYAGPSFVTQPTNNIILTGREVVLVADVMGRLPFEYQWQKDGKDITSATNTTLVISNAQVADSGVYTLRASDVIGVSNSAPATLLVKDIIVTANYQVVTGQVFSALDSCSITLQSRYTNGSLFYTLDGSQPDFNATPYHNGWPIMIYTNSTLRVIAYSADFSQSSVSEAINISILPRYTLNIINDEGGSVLLDPPNGYYASNTVVTLRAQPSSGWEFMGWSGALTGSVPIQTITVNENKGVIAFFGTKVETTVAGSGTVSIYPPIALHRSGTPVLVQAIPEPGSYFGVWGNYGSGSKNPFRFTVTTATPRISALFSVLPAKEVALTVLSEGLGTVTAPLGNKFPIGTTNVLTAVPGEGQQFVNWSGDASGSENPLSVVMDKSRIITANFTKVTRLAIQRTNPSFILWISGNVGEAYQIEASTNLSTWEPILFTTNAFGTEAFSDPDKREFPCRVYRAVMP